MEAFARRLGQHSHTKHEFVHEICEIMNPDRPTEKHFLVLGNLHCYVFAFSPPPGQLVTLAEHCWFDVSVVSLPGPDLIGFVFSMGSFTVRTPKWPDIVAFVVQHLRRILTPAELARTSLPAITAPVVAANSASFLFSLRSRLKLAGVRHVAKEVASVSRALETRSEKLLNLTFGSNNQQVLPILFQCISLKNRFKQLGFDPIGSILFDCLANHWAGLASIVHFTLSDPPTSAFIEKVRSSDNKNLVGFTFSGVAGTDEVCARINDLVQVSGISSLGFKGGLDRHSIIRIASNSNFQNIRSFLVDRIETIHVGRLFSSLSHVTTLSLTNCGLAIGEVFEAIRDFHSLVAVNLSGNLGTGWNGRLTFPLTLMKVHAANVQWNVKVFGDFLRVCAEHDSPGEFSLSVANAQFNDGRWSEIDEVIANLQAPKVTSLTWDGNALSQSFFQFLSSCPSLRGLSICGCVRPDDLPFLTDFFRRNRRIDTLNMKGTKQAIPELPSLFEVLRRSKVIRQFDCSFNLIDDVAAEALAQWAIRSRTLTFIAFDGTAIPTIDRLVQIYDASVMRERPLHIPFPDADVSRLKHAGSSDPSQINRLKHTLREIRKPRAHRKPIAPDSKPFAPFDVFCDVIDDQFAEFIPKGSLDVPYEVVCGLKRPLKRAPSKEGSDDSSDGAKKPLRIPGKKRSPYASPEKATKGVRTIGTQSPTPPKSRRHKRRSPTPKLGIPTMGDIGSPHANSDEAPGRRMESSPKKRAAREALPRRPTENSDDSPADGASSHVASGSPRRLATEFESRSDTQRARKNAEVDQKGAISTRKLPTGKVGGRHIKRTPGVRVRSPERRREWRFPVEYPPEINNSEIVESLNTKHSLESLLTAVRRT
jgi:hypothetical protein